MSPQMIFYLGGTLRKIHDRSKSYTQGIRSDDDRARYDELFQHRFGYRHNVGLDELVEHLRKEGYRQLILGDASPKNIGVNNGGELFTFFDLETAHKGNAMFDFAYLLAHIILHNLSSTTDAIDYITSYYKGYGKQDYNEGIVKKIVLGIMLYRLGGIVPYPTQLSIGQEETLKEKAEQVLTLRLEDITWPELMYLLRYEQH